MVALTLDMGSRALEDARAPGVLSTGETADCPAHLPGLLWFAAGMTDETALLDAFFPACEEAFDRLVTRFGFRLTSKERKERSCAMVFESAAAAIEVGLDAPENRVYVRLMRLIEGRQPPYIGASEHWCYLETVMAVRWPVVYARQKPVGDWLTRDDLTVMLQQNAGALQRHAADFLRGRFDVLDEVRAYRERMRDQQLPASVAPPTHKA